MGDVLFWDWTNGEQITTSPASGVYCYDAYAGEQSYKILNPALNEFYLKFRIKWDNASYWYYNKSYPYLNYDAITIANFTFEETTQYWVAYINGVKVASYDVDMNSNQWYLMELYYKLHSTSGSLIMKIDGIQRLTYGGNTNPTSQPGINRIVWASSSSFCTPHQHRYLDDLALNDTSGSIDNSWCGPGRVERLAPNQDGDVLQWTPSSGSHFQCVDEVPPNDNTDYVSADQANKKDAIHLAAFTDTNKTIERVWIETRAADYASMGSRMRAGLLTSGSYFMGDDVQLPYSYMRVMSPVYPKSPITGNAWSKAELDALQAVVESRE
jgi:hypothetical protein